MQEDDMAVLVLRKDFFYNAMLSFLNFRFLSSERIDIHHAEAIRSCRELTTRTDTGARQTRIASTERADGVFEGNLLEQSATIGIAGVL
jgi:hypothetical protein